MLVEEWESFKNHISEICVKWIRVNQGVGVPSSFPENVHVKYIPTHIALEGSFV